MTDEETGDGAAPAQSATAVPFNILNPIRPLYNALLKDRRYTRKTIAAGTAPQGNVVAMNFEQFTALFGLNISGFSKLTMINDTIIRGIIKGRAQPSDAVMRNCRNVLYLLPEATQSVATTLLDEIDAILLPKKKAGFLHPPKATFRPSQIEFRSFFNLFGLTQDGFLGLLAKTPSTVTISAPENALQNALTADFFPNPDLFVVCREIARTQLSGEPLTQGLKFLAKAEKLSAEEKASHQAEKDEHRLQQLTAFTYNDGGAQIVPVDYYREQLSALNNGQPSHITNTAQYLYALRTALLEQRGLVCKALQEPTTSEAAIARIEKDGAKNADRHLIPKLANYYSMRDTQRVGTDATLALLFVQERFDHLNKEKPVGKSKFTHHHPVRSHAPDRKAGPVAQFSPDAKYDMPDALAAPDGPETSGDGVASRLLGGASTRPTAATIASGTVPPKGNGAGRG